MSCSCLAHVLIMSAHAHVYLAGVSAHARVHLAAGHDCLDLFDPI